VVQVLKVVQGLPVQ
jgi:hypothetical protein